MYLDEKGMTNGGKDVPFHHDSFGLSFLLNVFLFH